MMPVLLFQYKDLISFEDGEDGRLLLTVNDHDLYDWLEDELTEQYNIESEYMTYPRKDEAVLYYKAHQREAILRALNAIFLQ